jgi:ElaB/YqjD/DUF883 family membrane-anchored ribosome-binding protein
MFGLTERRSRSMKDSFNIEDFYDHLGSLRELLQELAASAGKSTRWQYGRARDVATEAAEEAEKSIRDNLAASLIVAVGIGLVIGYLIRRGSE